MKHKHYDLICQWAADASRKVEWSQNGGRTWHALSSGPLWDESVEYRFADSVLRYRVALFENGSERWTSTSINQNEAAAKEKLTTFVRWITDWTEVIESPVEKMETVNHNLWLVLRADGGWASYSSESSAITHAKRVDGQVQHIEWGVPA